MKKLLILLILLPFMGFSQFVNENFSNNFYYTEYGVESFTKDHNDNLLMIGSHFFGGGDNVLIKKEENLFNYYQVPDIFLYYSEVKYIKCDSYDNIWVGTSNGLAMFDGYNWTYPVFEGSYNANNIKGIELAQNGDVWIATPQGIHVFNGSTFYSYTTTDGLPSNVVKSLSKGSDGKMWIGTQGGLCRFDGVGFASFDIDGAWNSNQILQMEAAEDIFLINPEGLKKYNGEVFVEMDSLLPEGFIASEILDIATDDNNLWVLFEHDLLKFNNLGLELIINSSNSNLTGYWDFRKLFIYNSEIYIGKENGYSYSDLSFLIPENLQPNLDTINVNNQEYWMHLEGLSASASQQKSFVMMGATNENGLFNIGVSNFIYGTYPPYRDSLEYVAKYHKTWNVYQEEIENHIINWETEGYEIPFGIKCWPEEADYVDVNSNFIYDPEQGDYPLIRGDQAILSISNDNGGLGLEQYALSYAYASENSALNNTVFTNYKIKNKSDHNYHSVYFSIDENMDIGSPYNDYVGTDTSLNGIYFYNSTNTDELLPSGNIPARALVFLNSKLSSTIYYKNIYNDDVNSKPNYFSDFNNYVRGFWKDGTPTTYGGNAVGGDSAVSYVFTGDPVNGTGWNEYTEGNIANDKSVYAVIGPFDLDIGEEICIDIARIEAISSTHLLSVKELKNSMSHIHSWYGNQDYVCDSLIAESTDTLSVLANDIYALPYESVNVQVYSYPTGGMFPYSFEWFDENGILVSELQNPTISSSTEEMDYYVIVTDNLGDTATDTLTIHPYVFPEINLGTDTSICYGDTLELSVPYNLPCYWSNGSTDSLIHVSESGFYVVYVLVEQNNGWGYGDGDSIYVEVIRPEINFQDITAACLNEEVELSVYDYPTILWSTGETTPEIILNTSSIVAEYYSVFVTDTNGCSNKDSTLFLVNPLPNIDLGGDMTILDTQSVLLNAYVSAGAEYEWSTGQNSYSMLFNGSIGEGAYDIGVDITDVNGCEGSGNITIQVDFFQSMNENSEYSINIYPNPSTDYMIIELLKASKYMLYDDKGVLVKAGKFESKQNNLQVSGLVQGTYFLFIASLNIRKKLIIQ